MTQTSFSRIAGPGKYRRRLTRALLIASLCMLAALLLLRLEDYVDYDSGSLRSVVSIGPWSVRAKTSPLFGERRFRKGYGRGLTFGELPITSSTSALTGVPDWHIYKIGGVIAMFGSTSGYRDGGGVRAGIKVLMSALEHWPDQERRTTIKRRYLETLRSSGSGDVAMRYAMGLVTIADGDRLSSTAIELGDVQAVLRR